MKNLTVILGPNNADSGQHYAIYRYNGIAFTAVDPKVDALPLGLGAEGTTTHWFSPKAFITTTFRHKQKQIIGFNYGDKTINKLELKRSAGHKIGNRYWDVLVSDISVQSFSYHLIELKVTETQRKLLLITQQMVYQVIDDKRLEEVMVRIITESFNSFNFLPDCKHPWNLFGCNSGTILQRIGLRSGEIAPKFNRSGVKLDEYEGMDSKLAIQLVITNVIYISLISLIFGLIFYI